MEAEYQRMEKRANNQGQLGNLCFDVNWCRILSSAPIFPSFSCWLTAPPRLGGRRQSGLLPPTSRPRSRPITALVYTIVIAPRRSSSPGLNSTCLRRTHSGYAAGQLGDRQRRWRLRWAKPAQDEEKQSASARSDHGFGESLLRGSGPALLV